MCSPVALETALRSTLRKLEGVDCVAIAVDAISFIAGVPVECIALPIRTRLSQAIYDNRLVAQYSSDNTGIPIDCNEVQGWETLLHSVLREGDEGTGVTLMDLWAPAIAGDATCPTDCEDDGVGLAERFLGSLHKAGINENYSVRVVDVADGDPIKCNDMTPTETLLKSAFVRQPDGLWAMRVILEL